MPDLLRFEWSRDRKGYEIKHVPRQTIAGRPTILTEAIAAEHDEIAGRGGRLQSYRPFAAGPALYKEFCDLKPTGPAIVKFASRYGLLTERKGNERLDYWQDAIKGMRKSVLFAESGNLDAFVRAWNQGNMARLAVTFDPVIADGRPTMRITPQTLHDALWLQVAQSLSSATGLRQCVECGSWFVFGTGTGRRKSADYCSDRCRKAAWRHRNSNRAPAA